MKNEYTSEKKLASRPEPNQDNDYSNIMYITLDTNDDAQSNEDYVLWMVNVSKNQALYLNGNKVMFCGVMVKHRNFGIMCPILSGLWGGSILLGFNLI